MTERHSSGMEQSKTKEFITGRDFRFQVVVLVTLFKTVDLLFQKKAIDTSK